MKLEKIVKTKFEHLGVELLYLIDEDNNKYLLYELEGVYEFIQMGNDSEVNYLSLIKKNMEKNIGLFDIRMLVSVGVAQGNSTKIQKTMLSEIISELSK